MQHSSRQSRCVVCDCPFDNSNDSDEHVIPNSVGGRLKVRGFICVRCNSKTGETWDKTLSDELNFFCLFFGIVRERGEPRAEAIETTAGEKLLMQPGGGFKMQQPVFREVPAEVGKQIQMKARSMSEARRMLEGVARKHPQVDVAGELAKATSVYTYPEGLVHHSPTLGGPSSGRSIVKTAVAFAYHAGVPIDRCDLGLVYLRDESAPPPYGFFYERDLVTGRPAGVPIHCVAVSANPQTGLLLGYVEYFGVHRVVLCLSKSYTGPVVEQGYGLNPLTGLPAPVRVNLPFSIEDIEAIYDYEKIPDGSVERAYAAVMPAALVRSFEQEKVRAIADATRYAFENCGAKEGEMLTEEQKARLPGLITERLMPFILRHAARR
jgi:hypothetical protein